MKEYGKKFLEIAVVISILLIAGCIDQQPAKELYNFTKDGVEYVFDNNIYYSLAVPMQEHEQIVAAVRNASYIAITFNGTNQTENSWYLVVSWNLVERLRNYYEYTQGRFMRNYIKGYELGELSAAMANGTLPANAVVIELRGPAAGANATSVEIVPSNRTWILVQGVNFRNLTMAGDALALAVIGFEE
jgi:hypothetical protein